MNSLHFLLLILLCIRINSYRIKPCHQHHQRRQGRIFNSNNRGNNNMLEKKVSVPKVNSRMNIKNLQQQLAKYSQAGLLGYGLMNLLYYSTATTIVWKQIDLSHLSSSLEYTSFRTCLKLGKFQKI